METQAIMSILLKCNNKEWSLIGSEILDKEIENTPNLITRNKLYKLYSMSNEIITLNDKIKFRAYEIEKYGVKSMDSLHIACAEYAEVSVFLTTDIDLLKMAKRFQTSIRIDNPLIWFMEVINNE
jgi:predicted nucleic acid-binding protein